MGHPCSDADLHQTRLQPLCLSSSFGCTSPSRACKQLWRFPAWSKGVEGALQIRLHPRCWVSAPDPSSCCRALLLLLGLGGRGEGLIYTLAGVNHPNGFLYKALVKEEAAPIVRTWVLSCLCSSTFWQGRASCRELGSASPGPGMNPQLGAYPEQQGVQGAGRWAAEGDAATS